MLLERIPGRRVSNPKHVEKNKEKYAGDGLQIFIQWTFSILLLGCSLLSHLSPREALRGTSALEARSRRRPTPKNPSDPVALHHTAACLFTGIAQ